MNTVQTTDRRKRRLRAGLAFGCGVALAASALNNPAGATTAAQGVRVELSAGGPYRAIAGGEVTLEGSAAIAGQSDMDRDLQAIGLALRAYHEANGSYPPAALAGPSGRPLLSWRVLLLPYLGEEALYRRFDLTKPWNHPTNRPLLTKMPAVYRSGTQRKNATETAYVGSSGPGRFFVAASTSLGGGVKRSDVTDGTDMTLAVGPSGARVRIPWTAPGDLDVSANSSLGTPTGFDGAGNEVTPLLFVDGKTRRVLDTTSADLVAEWSTIASTAGCTPPDADAVQLAPTWDLDGDGRFETLGLKATLTNLAAGVRQVNFRVYDSRGGEHTSVAVVKVT